MMLPPSPDRPPRSAKLASAALATVCAGLLTAACSGTGGHPRAASQPGARRLWVSASASAHAAPTVVPSTTPAARRPAPAPRSSVPASPPPVPAPTAAPAPSVTGLASPAPLAQCPTSGLRISVGSPGSAAGSFYYPLDFTNISGAACGMYGYPGVSFVSSPGGGEVGAAAIRNPTPGPSLVTLAPGAVAHSSVRVVVAQNYPASVCKPVTAHWLRVYPPDQYEPLYADLTAMTCTGSIPGGSTLGIFVIRPGASGS